MGGRTPGLTTRSLALQHATRRSWHTEAHIPCKVSFHESFDTFRISKVHERKVLQLVHGICLHGSPRFMNIFHARFMKGETISPFRTSADASCPTHPKYLGSSFPPLPSQRRGRYEAGKHGHPMHRSRNKNTDTPILLVRWSDDPHRFPDLGRCFWEFRDVQILSQSFSFFCCTLR